MRNGRRCALRPLGAPRFEVALALVSCVITSPKFRTGCSRAALGPVGDAGSAWGVQALRRSPSGATCPARYPRCARVPTWWLQLISADSYKDCYVAYISALAHPVRN